MAIKPMDINGRWLNQEMEDYFNVLKLTMDDISSAFYFSDLSSAKEVMALRKERQEALQPIIDKMVELRSHYWNPIIYVDSTTKTKDFSE